MLPVPDLPPRLTLADIERYKRMAERAPKYDAVLVLPRRVFDNPEALAWARKNWPNFMIVEQQS